MKTVIALALTLCLTAAPASAAGPGGQHGQNMREDVDGNLQHGEYIKISPNGSITRALCPYSCNMRGIPQGNCKTWKSVQHPDQCYVQDTRIPSDAVPVRGKLKEEKGQQK